MGSFVDPPLAGFLLANAVPAPFKFDAVIFALAVRLVWSISMPHRKSALRGKVWPEIVEGWTWMRALPAILRLAVMLGLIHALSMMPMTILVPCSQDLLGLSAIGYGTLLEGGRCRWCEGQPSRSTVCRTGRRTKQHLPCPHNDGRPLSDHSAGVKPICYGVRTLERDDHSSTLECCYRIVLPRSQSGRFAWPGGFSLSFLRLGPDGSCCACRAWIVSIATRSLGAEMAIRMP